MPVHHPGVLCVSALESNLLSVSALTKAGFAVTFAKEECSVSKGGKVLPKGLLHNSVYVVNNAPAKAVVVTNKDCRANCIHLWHRRLGMDGWVAQVSEQSTKHWHC